jgi:hypothetical protein
MHQKIESKPKNALQTNTILTQQKHERTLQLNILKGRAFVGLNRIQDSSSTIQVHVSFGQIRSSSEPIISDIEPTINLTASFVLPVTILLTIAQRYESIIRYRISYPCSSYSQRYKRKYYNDRSCQYRMEGSFICATYL